MITSRKGDSPIVKQAMEIMDAAAEKLGPELLDAAVLEPTLDRYLDRSPKIGQPINYEEMVGVLQRKRQMFITAEQKKKSGEKADEKTEDETV